MTHPGAPGHGSLNGLSHGVSNQSQAQHLVISKPSLKGLGMTTWAGAELSAATGAAQGSPWRGVRPLEGLCLAANKAW